MPQQWRIASQATSPTSSVRSWQSSGSPQRGPYAPDAPPIRRQTAAEALAQRGIHFDGPRKSQQILALASGESTAHASSGNPSGLSGLEEAQTNKYKYR